MLNVINFAHGAQYMMGALRGVLLLASSTCRSGRRWCWRRSSSGFSASS